MLWDAETGEERATIEHPAGVNNLAYSPDGTLLAIVSRPPWNSPPEPADVRLYDLAARKDRAHLRGHRGAALCVAFSPDGKALATGGGHYADFGEARLWDVATGRELASVADLKEWAECLAFLPGGKAPADRRRHARLPGIATFPDAAAPKR